MKLVLVFLGLFLASLGAAWWGYITLEYSVLTYGLMAALLALLCTVKAVRKMFKKL